MAVVYWSWYWPSGDRRSYKQHLDPVCGMPTMHMIQKGLNDEEHCMGCGERVTDRPDVTVYTTVYVPGRDRIDADLVYDAVCFEKIADQFTIGAQRLLDRPLQEGGPPPGATDVNPWADLPF